MGGMRESLLAAGGRVRETVGRYVGLGAVKRWLKRLAIALVALAVIIAALFAAGILGIPSAGLVDRGDWETIQEDRVTVVSTYYVDNPNPFGVSSAGARVEYNLSLNGIVLARGTKEGISVPAGNSTGTVTSELDQERLPAWWRSHVRNGERSSVVVRMNATVPLGPFGPVSPPVPTIRRNISTNITGAMASSLAQYEGPYPETSPQPIIVVRDTDVAWGEVADGETPIHVTFVVHNPNPTVVPVPAFAGDLELNGIVMAHWNASEVQVRDAPDDGTIGPGETEEITLAARLQTERLDEWLRSHARRGERSNLTVTGALAIQYQGETYTFPQPGGFRCTGSLQTAIFVDEQATDAGIDQCRLVDADAGQTAREGAELFADGLGLPGTNDSENGSDDGDGGILDTPTDDGSGTDTPTDDGGIFGTPTDDGGTPTATESDDSDTQTPAPTPTPTPTPTDDGIL